MVFIQVKKCSTCNVSFSVGIDIVGYFVLALNTSQSLVLDEITEYMSSLNSDANVSAYIIS